MAGKTAWRSIRKKEAHAEKGPGSLIWIEHDCGDKDGFWINPVTKVTIWKLGTDWRYFAFWESEESLVIAILGYNITFVYKPQGKWCLKGWMLDLHPDFAGHCVKEVEKYYKRFSKGVK